MLTRRLCLAALLSCTFAWGTDLNLPNDEFQTQARALTRQQIPELAALAAAGDARAQCVLGIAYANGFAVPPDQAEAAQWLRRAADQHVGRAANDLGYLYKHGEGVPQSDTEAVKWYQRAAEVNNPKGETNLGFMYSKGLGVKQDFAQALK